MAKQCGTIDPEVCVCVRACVNILYTCCYMYIIIQDHGLSFLCIYNII